MKTSESIDHINPSHYKEFSVECIEMMSRIWGDTNTALYCEMNAFKYKIRAGSKTDQPVERDLEKAKWYQNYRETLLKRLETAKPRTYDHSSIHRIIGVYNDIDITSTTTGRIQDAVTPTT
jgi:hypothetical protein